MASKKELMLFSESTSLSKNVFSFEFNGDSSTGSNKDEAVWDEELLSHLSLHACRQTLLVSTILAAVSLPFVNRTVPVVSTSVGQVFAHSSLKKTLASFAAVHTIMLSAGFVAAYGANGFGRWNLTELLLLLNINGSGGGSSGRLKGHQI
ncbi:hypothetical protein BpHYR1_026185 [Brachionus plicatilis]|uniref:Uncharacterized protein n=1 Tax=Brachionus plicatilis TaxID=10195 RepID=A0A3M7T9U8_BRAPC|nr:hypothetical protein BpHYR1_026185 [Brachionus plicatilis]